MLLGGPPRCGKTRLAGRVAAERGIGWLSTDTIRDVVNMLMPALYESGGPGRDPGPEADLLFPFFERAVESCSYLVDDYLIEGVGFAAGTEEARRLLLETTSMVRDVHE